MVTFCSGTMVLGIEIVGRKCVSGSSILIGTTPYKRIGKSLVRECGCINETCTYTFGAISGVILNLNTVLPFSVSNQCASKTLLPFSIETKALPFCGEGMVITASSPVLYFALSVVKLNMFETILLSLPPSRSIQLLQSK